jgi:hypothetical protein
MDGTSIKSHYPTVANSIIFRLRVADRLLGQINENRDAEDSWVHADSVALQVRKVCELILLGSTLAHLQDGADLDPKHWRPKEAFMEIAKLNGNPLPLPLHPYISVDENGFKQFIPSMKPMTYAALTRVYGLCGDLLHVPSAEKVLSEKVTPFDWNRFRAWVTDLTMLMRAHVLLLPSIQSVIVCLWSGNPEDAPEIILTEGAGEGFLNADGLKDFDLLTA